MIENEFCRADDLVAQKIEMFFPSLKTISTEFSSWEDSSRRLDILAIDRESKNLVVIELKRDKDGAHAELQALRYAAMLSVCTFDNVVEEGLKYRKKIGQDVTPSELRKELLDFLEEDLEETFQFPSIPKIFLLSSEFKKEITTTVLWLYEKVGMDISCFEIGLYELQGGYGLHFDQIIPIIEAQEYQIKARKKNLDSESAKQVAIKRQQRSVTILEEAKRLVPGETKVVVIAKLSKNFDLNESDQKQATYLGNGKFRWDFDGSEHASLNALTKTIFQQNGEEMGALQCPDYWGRVGQGLSLAKEAKKHQQQGSIQQVAA